MPKPSQVQRRRMQAWAKPAALAASLGLLFAMSLQAGAIDLTLHTVATGVPLTGSGTNTATLNFGTVSAFESLPAGVSRTTGASSFTVSTQFGVKVVRNSGTSPNYRLQCRLKDPIPVTVEVNGVTMTTSGYVTVATAQPYGSIISHTVSVIVPFSQAPGAITTRIDVQAVSN